LAFSVDFLSGISSCVDSSVFLWIRDQIAPLCAGSSFFRGKFCISFWGCLWPRSPQVLDSSSPSSLWFFLLSVESG
jgi:hypothetical protein